MKRELPQGAVIAIVALTVIAAIGGVWMLLGDRAPKSQTPQAVVTPIVPGKPATDNTGASPDQRSRQRPTPEQADDEINRDEDQPGGE